MPTHKRRALRGILALVAVGGLAAAAFTIADLAASASAKGTSTHRPRPAAHVASATSPSAAKTGGVNVPRLAGHGFLHDIAGLPGGAGALTGKVTAIGKGTITIASAANGKQVIRTDSSTQYFTMLTKGTSKNVTVGDRVEIVLALVAYPVTAGPATPPSAGPTSSSSTSAPPTTVTTPTPPPVQVASAVIVIEPWAVGTVVSVSSSEIVVTSNGGLERDVLVNGSTGYSEAGTTVGSDAVSRGEQVFAYGSAASDPTELQATNVVVIGPSVSGVVSSVSGSTIAIIRSGQNGGVSLGSGGTTTSPVGSATETITTNSSTIFRSGNTSSSLGAIKKGDFLYAIGTGTAKGSFAATAVTFSPPPTVTPGGPRTAPPGVAWAYAAPVAVATTGLGGLIGIQGPAGSVFNAVISAELTY
ncbi:MAG: DUF5666 domain-containing protein [Acidimicrobiales bacterium]